MLTYLASFVVAALLTGLSRRYLLSRRVLDIPNDRSSHSVPTPRGGGIGIVVVFLLAIPWLMHKGLMSGSLGSALAGGGILIAAVGLLDDRFGLSSRLRLLAHFAAAGWAIWRLGGVAPLYWGLTSPLWIWIGTAVALVGLAWLVNLYNFMDGIDGLAGVEAVTVGGLGGLLMALSGVAGHAEGAWVLAAASCGFLAWNWPPARIFMGDVGSGFLGFVLGVFVLSSAKAQPGFVWPWAILLSVFLVDSTATLIRRMMSGARWYEAHCSHAYQNTARQWRSHSKVTLAIAAVNLFWLFPLAWGASLHPAVGPVLLALATAPLVYFAIRQGAGQESPVPAGKQSEAEGSLHEGSRG